MKEEKWYIVPELEIRVHEAWINLVQYCQDNLQYGDLKIEISNALPGKRLDEIPKIRFDKPSPSEVKGTWYIISSLNVRVHESWVNLIQWCQNYFQSGSIKFRLVAGQPTELLGASQKVNFGKSETLPIGLPLRFDT